MNNNMANNIGNNELLLDARNLTKYYPVKTGFFAEPKQVKAVDGVSFTLGKAKTLAIVGESGCGKSSLARLLTMIEKPTSGELYFKDQNLLDDDPQAQKLRRQKIQIVFQNPYSSLIHAKKLVLFWKNHLLLILI